VPQNVVENYQGERQHEGNECAQPELNPAIRLSLLGYIAHWPARLGRLIVKRGSSCVVP